MQLIPLPRHQAERLLAQGRRVFVGYKRGLAVRNQHECTTLEAIDKSMQRKPGQGVPQCYVASNIG
jgi:hypothetical protein